MEVILNSLLFGDGNHRLYGVYHPPLCQAHIQKSILLCSPPGPEYARTYRLLRMLAENLSKKGNHVLRFDWYGNGDSWGDSTEGNITNWIKDVKLASEELISISGNKSISVIGLRFGATIACLSSLMNSSFDSLILWEPVINGKLWIDYLKKLHQSYISKSPLKGRALCTDNEIIGNPFSTELQQEISNISLLQKPVPNCNVMHLINYTASQELNLYFDYCKNSNCLVSIEILNAPSAWTSNNFSLKVIMADPAVQNILKYFTWRDQ